MALLFNTSCSDDSLIFKERKKAYQMIFILNYIFIDLKALPIQGMVTAGKKGITSTSGFALYL